MQNFNLLEVKFLRATNCKGARVKITSERMKESVVIPFDYQFNGTDEIAVDYLKKNGIEVLGMGEVRGAVVLIVAGVDGQFQSIKK